MNSKKFALYGGIVMLILGVVSLIPGLEGSTAGLPALKIDTSYGLFLNMFPLNIFNKVALIIFGIAGVFCGRNENMTYSWTYCSVVFFVFGLLSLLGLFPQTNTLDGMWPLYGGEVVAHGLFAIASGLCVLSDTKGHHRTFVTR